MEYRVRSIDNEIGLQLKSSGAVLIRGVKGCGKTESARRHAKSEVVIDDSPAVENAMQSDPAFLLKGETPRLIDEWQEQPKLWNTIRHEVDNRRSKGQFILTGSANPEENAKLHSGVGRFGVIKMRTMSLFERGWSTGEVRLADLLGGGEIESRMMDANLDEIASWLTIGGWPGNLELGEEASILNLKNYYELLTEVDLSRVSNVRRDPQKVNRVLQSIARNIATECAVSTIAKDAGGADGPLANDTVIDYVEALNRLMIEEDLPAWNTHIRSSAKLRKAAKRHFVDPSLAAAALGLDSGKILSDLEYMGYLFESLVIRDLRIYADRLGAKLYHYRDSNGVEADAILEKRDGAWAAFEIKLGFGATEKAAASLKKFSETVDQKKVGAPLALAAITGSGFAHRRADGIAVIPVNCLRW